MPNKVFVHLTHEQQQQAVEQIQVLMAQGMSSGEAIAKVAQQLRESAVEKTDKVTSISKNAKIL